MANGFNLRRDELTDEDREQLERPTVHLVLTLATKDLRNSVSRRILRLYADQIRGLASALEFASQNREERLPRSIIRIKGVVNDVNKRNRKIAKTDLKVFE